MKNHFAAPTCYLTELVIMSMLLAHCRVKSSGTHAPYLKYGLLRSSLFPCTALKQNNFSYSMFARFLHLRLWLGMDEARTEPYFGYGSGVLESITPPESKSTSRVASSASKQAGAVHGPRAVIFDFDGTLADTEGLLRQIYNDMAKQKKWQRLNNRQYRRLFTATIGHALRWSRFRPWRFLYLVRQSRKHLHTAAGQISLFKGIPELIKQLDKAGYDLYVLSYNVSSTISLVLEHREIIDKLIVLDQPVFFRKHVRINELVKRKGYERSNVWMVGDEKRDIAAAQKAEVPSIAVTWGLQNVSVLKKSHPTHLVNNPSDIAKILISR